MLAYGAELFRVRGFGPDPEITRRTFEAIVALAKAPDAALQISAFACSPAGMSGVQSISYELDEQLQNLKQPIDHVFSPAGGGGLTLATARGFEALRRVGASTATPRVECVQPAGNDTMASALRDGRDAASPVTCTSQVSGLQVPTVIDGNDVIRACRATGGSGHVVSDEEVWSAQARMAQEDGIFCEPAGATALAGALRARGEGRIAADATIACLVTGSGFKDPPSVQRLIARRSCPIVELAELEERVPNVV
jgi:threonine synthase